MRESPFEAAWVDVDVTTQGPELIVTYEIDSGHTGSMRATYPFALERVDARLLQAIALPLAVYLGQLCLASEIRVSPRPANGHVRALDGVVYPLYAIRRWMDRRQMATGPVIITEDKSESSPEPTTRQRALQPRPLDAKSALMLMSGGKDSTLSTVVLGENGYSVSGVHLRINSGVEGREEAAATRIASKLSVPLELVGFSHPDFIDLSSRYANVWNDFPYSNRVPFGRDLLSIVIALPVALQKGCGSLSLGHDGDCRVAFVDYEGERVPRNDVEHCHVAACLESYLKDFAEPGIRLIPPVASVTEFRILETMLTQFPDLMRETSFCFWGHNCGRCSKCLRYYLAQRVLGVEALRFDVSPLAAGACPELDDLLAPRENRSLLFQDAVLWCLSTLVDRKDVRASETRLAALAADGWSMPGDPSQVLRQLVMERQDPQLPEDFRFPEIFSSTHRPG